MPLLEIWVISTAEMLLPCVNEFIVVTFDKRFDFFQLLP